MMMLRQLFDKLTAGNLNRPVTVKIRTLLGPSDRSSNTVIGTAVRFRSLERVEFEEDGSVVLVVEE